MDVLGNVAVFVPFGAALAVATLLGRPKRRKGRKFWLWWLAVTGAGLLFSLFIEIAQLAIPSRVTDVDDVILNTLGTGSGACAGMGRPATCESDMTRVPGNPFTIRHFYGVQHD